MRRPFLAGIALAAVAVCLAVLVPSGECSLHAGLLHAYNVKLRQQLQSHRSRSRSCSHYRATPDRVGFHVQYHTGWSDKSGDGQWFETARIALTSACSTGQSGNVRVVAHATIDTTCGTQTATTSTLRTRTR